MRPRERRETRELAQDRDAAGPSYEGLERVKKKVALHLRCRLATRHDLCCRIEGRAPRRHLGQKLDEIDHSAARKGSRIPVRLE